MTAAVWMVGLMLLASAADGADQLTIERDGIKMAGFVREAYKLPYTDAPFLDYGKLERFLHELDKQAYMKPTNAMINEHGQIMQGLPGARLNRSETLNRLLGYWYNGGPARLELPTDPVYPKVDAELLADIRVRPIGSYVTYFNANNKNRFYNIALAAKAIDNVVLFPGETFSFNEIVGMRTEQKGYRRAKIIVRGEFSEGIGGGICQISSTLFNAADRAGLRIVERYSHSRRVPYVPPGRDATVNWGGPDFKFENSYNQPVLIRAFALNGKVVIVISSSDSVRPDNKPVPNAAETVPEEMEADSGSGADG